MSSRIDWKKVKQAQRLFNKLGNVSKVAEKMGEHRRQVQRFLSYAKRGSIEMSQ